MHNEWQLQFFICVGDIGTGPATTATLDLFPHPFLTRCCHLKPFPSLGMQELVGEELASDPAEIRRKLQQTFAYSYCL